MFPNDSQQIDIESADDPIPALAGIGISIRGPSRPRHHHNNTCSTMPSGYASRDLGDPSQIKKNKQSMADLKLRRLTELNNRLREDLDRDRIPVSSASKSLIGYTNSTKDFMVPSVWGTVDKKDDPYAPQASGGCCVVM